MLDLRDDGTIGIDFEDGAAPVVLARPKFGAYKRLRAELDRVRVEIPAFQSKLVDAAVAEAGEGATIADIPKEKIAEINEQSRDHSDEVTAAWWKLILIGDDSFKNLVIEGTVPPSPEDWPAYLIYGAAVIPQMVEHWRKIPLARGGVPVTKEAEATPTTE